MQRAVWGSTSPRGQSLPSGHTFVSRLSISPKTRSPACQRVTPGPMLTTVPTPLVPVPIGKRFGAGAPAGAGVNTRVGLVEFLAREVHAVEQGKRGAVLAGGHLRLDQHLARLQFRIPVLDDLDTVRSGDGKTERHGGRASLPRGWAHAGRTRGPFAAAGAESSGRRHSSPGGRPGSDVSRGGPLIRPRAVPPGAAKTHQARPRPVPLVRLAGRQAGRCSTEPLPPRPPQSRQARRAW